LLSGEGITASGRFEPFSKLNPGRDEFPAIAFSRHPYADRQMTAFEENGRPASAVQLAGRTAILILPGLCFGMVTIG